MYFLHGGPAPALPGILPMRALKESESPVDNSSMFSTTHLPIAAFNSVCVTTFWEADAEKSRCSCSDSSVSFFVSRAHVSHTWPAVITNSVNNGVYLREPITITYVVVPPLPPPFAALVAESHNEQLQFVTRHI